MTALGVYMSISYRPFFVYIVKRTYRQVCIYRYRHLYRQCIWKILKTCIYVYIHCIWKFWYHVYIHVYMIYRQPWILKTCIYVYIHCIWNLKNVYIRCLWNFENICLYVYIQCIWNIFYLSIWCIYTRYIYKNIPQIVYIIYTYRHPRLQKSIKPSAEDRIQ